MTALLGHGRLTAWNAIRQELAQESDCCGFALFDHFVSQLPVLKVGRAQEQIDDLYRVKQTHAMLIDRLQDELLVQQVREPAPEFSFSLTMSASLMIGVVAPPRINRQ